MTNTTRKHSIYFKHVANLQVIDIYRFFELFEVTNPCLQHAIKKLVVPGLRNGGKSSDEDVQEAIDSLERWQEMRYEDTGAAVFLDVESMTEDEIQQLRQGLDTATTGPMETLSHVDMNGKETQVGIFKHQPGEVLGANLPDFPNDLKTFAERLAYQRGVGDARYVQRMAKVENVQLVTSSECKQTFEDACAQFEAAGYQYGDDALRNVRLGWDMAKGYRPAKKSPAPMPKVIPGSTREAALERLSFIHANIGKENMRELVACLFGVGKKVNDVPDDKLQEVYSLIEFIACVAGRGSVLQMAMTQIEIRIDQQARNLSANDLETAAVKQQLIEIAASIASTLRNNIGPFFIQK